MVLKENYVLSNGVEIPKIGLGTWFIADDTASELVQSAIDLGYRHIDTAQAYGNENGVGIGIKSSGVSRVELFVTTKLAAEIKSYEEANIAIDNSLKTLGLDYIDMMLIHSPKPWAEYGNEDRYFQGNSEAWRALEDAYQAGKLRAIGVSNFKEEDIEKLLEKCTVKPMANQILAHIGNTPKELVGYCQYNDILVQAYSPIAHGVLLNNRDLSEMAATYNVSVAQLSIRYCIQLGLLPLPKTTNPKNMENNADIDFEISPKDMDTLENLEPIKDYGEAGIFPVFWKEQKMS